MFQHYDVQWLQIGWGNKHLHTKDTSIINKVSVHRTAKRIQVDEFGNTKSGVGDVQFVLVNTNSNKSCCT